jgi:hypothetical protein
MSDDDRNVSAREWRAVREGDTHSAPKTSSNNTPESFIVGVGASGALLAGAAIVFVTLVGLVSFNVWPTAQDATSDGNVELSAATPRAPANSTVAPLSAAAGQLAAANVGTSGGTGGGNGNGNGGNNKGGNGKPKTSPAPTPPSTPPAPTPPDTGGSTGPGDGSTGSGGPVNAIKDPSHPVTPTHPSNPHQDTPDGQKGKDPGDDGDGTGIGVVGKPPVVRPPSILTPSQGQSSDQGGSSGSSGGSSGSSDDGDSSPSGGDHGCSHSHHHH